MQPVSFPTSPPEDADAVSDALNSIVNSIVNPAVTSASPWPLEKVPPAVSSTVQQFNISVKQAPAGARSAVRTVVRFGDRLREPRQRGHWTACLERSWCRSSRCSTLLSSLPVAHWRGYRSHVSRRRERPCRPRRVTSSRSESGSSRSSTSHGLMRLALSRA